MFTRVTTWTVTPILFNRFVDRLQYNDFSSYCYPSYTALTLTVVSLSLTQHKRLVWTRKYSRNVPTCKSPTASFCSRLKEENIIQFSLFFHSLLSKNKFYRFVKDIELFFIPCTMPVRGVCTEAFCYKLFVTCKRACLSPPFDRTIRFYIFLFPISKKSYRQGRG